MLAKIAGLALTLTLLTLGVEVAGPPAAENLHDSTELAMTESAVPLYLSTIVTVDDHQFGGNGEF